MFVLMRPQSKLPMMRSHTAVAGPQIKRMRSPWSERSMWGATPSRRSVSSTKTDALRANLWEPEGRILFAPPLQEPPHLGSFIFKNWAGSLFTTARRFRGASGLPDRRQRALAGTRIIYIQCAVAEERSIQGSDGCCLLPSSPSPRSRTRAVRRYADP